MVFSSGFCRYRKVAALALALALALGPAAHTTAQSSSSPGPGVARARLQVSIHGLYPFVRQSRQTLRRMGFASYFRQWDAQLRRKLGRSLLKSAASWRRLGLDPQGSLYYGRTARGHWLALPRKGKAGKLPWQRLARLFSVLQATKVSPGEVEFQGQKVAGLVGKGGVVLPHQGRLWAFSSRSFMHRVMKSLEKGGFPGLGAQAHADKDKPVLHFAANDPAGIFGASPQVAGHWRVQPRALSSLAGSLAVVDGLHFKGKLRWNRRHFMGRRYSRLLSGSRDKEACTLKLPGRSLFDFRWHLPKLDDSSRRLLVHAAAPVLTFWWQRGNWPSAYDSRVLHVLHTLSPYIRGQIRAQALAHKRRLIFSVGVGVAGQGKSWWSDFLARLRGPKGRVKATLKELDSKKGRLVELSLIRNKGGGALSMKLYYDRQGSRIWLWSPRVTRDLSIWRRVAQWRKCRQKQQRPYHWAFYPKNLRYWARTTNDLFLLRQMLQGIASMEGSFGRVGGSKSHWRFDLHLKPAR